MVVKFRNTIWPPPPQLSLHRRAALTSNSNGTWSVYNRENPPKSSLYCEMSMKCTVEFSVNAMLWQGNGYHMDYNDELPTTTLNSLGNAVLPFLFSLLPSTLEFFTPVHQLHCIIRAKTG
jgi:hypothetical protein